ncbi:hypothetical protein RIF29_27620 [Crotalaria pallida]|uniref:HMA domain-containing protein n=1 Tax=Crotalaria pallida TaxID=3830 RepID=A0AAN9I5S1_CROPI
MTQQKQKKKEDSENNNKDNNKNNIKNDNNNKNNNKNDDNNNKKLKDVTTKKDETPVTVIMKVDMHCDGCASKIIRCLRGFQALEMKSNLVVNGAESLKAENEFGKLTITGEVDPNKLKENLANKMKKKLDLISPPTNKETDVSKSSNNNNKNKPAEKISKELPATVTTVVLKVALHCQGCIERIRKTILKTKGVHDMAIDKDKETVTVKGTMEVKVLVEKLRERLKRKVEVVPPKKEKEESGEKEGATGKGGKGNDKKKKGDNGENVKKENISGDGQGKENKVEQTKMETLTPSYGPIYGYGYGYGGDYSYGPVYMGQLHAPQMFSDENPNACSIL